MCADAGFHADQARWEIGDHLATRPLLPEHDSAARIVAHDVDRVLANIDADHGDRGIGCLRHGVLLVFAAPSPASSTGGLEHGRTIPLPDSTLGSDSALGEFLGMRAAVGHLDKGTSLVY
jgi:hypothetical protein